jgi:uncharacterized repeat protein (TIGR03803 family)
MHSPLSQLFQRPLALCELAPKGDGTWSEATLYDFEGTDGKASTAGLIFDAGGELYGTTAGGGTDGLGTVFELSPQSSGTWAETVLHSFSEEDDGVAAPYAGVVMDPSGNLFGTGGLDLPAFARLRWLDPDRAAQLHRRKWRRLRAPRWCNPGPCRKPLRHHPARRRQQQLRRGCGTVYELTAQPNGEWQKTILHSFGDGDGAFPGVGALARGKAGSLYGTRTFGIIFKLTPGADGAWKFKVLATVAGHPGAGIVIGKAGELYGTAIAGGGCGCGTV